MSDLIGVIVNSGACLRVDKKPCGIDHSSRLPHRLFQGLQKKIRQIKQLGIVLQAAGEKLPADGSHPASPPDSRILYQLPERFLISHGLIGKGKIRNVHSICQNPAVSRHLHIFISKEENRRSILVKGQGGFLKPRLKSRQISEISSMLPIRIDQKSIQIFFLHPL